SKGAQEVLRLRKLGDERRTILLVKLLAGSFRDEVHVAALQGRNRGDVVGDEAKDNAIEMPAPRHVKVIVAAGKDDLVARIPALEAVLAGADRFAVVFAFVEAFSEGLGVFFLEIIGIVNML